MSEMKDKVQQLVAEAVGNIREFLTDQCESELLEDLDLIDSHHAWYASELTALRAQLQAAEREKDEAVPFMEAVKNAARAELAERDYAIKEFLCPEEWRYHQPSHRPGLDAKLRDIELFADQKFGANWRVEHAKCVEELVRQSNRKEPHA